ncbi:hypothetical protein MN032_00345 [Agromyces atrinae]|uniref:hypothetical protein n=1 Tax=Agromyces atrinae TaxID=592376 RepID=UPI001F57097E|nr:hypothetical protein [Agromyces atrinae]MCI2956126.1 hypothetical protein [Agromyces atrinae]
MASALRRSVLVAAAAASVLFLSACNPGGGTVEDYSGLPVSDHEESGDHGDEAEFDGEPVAQWLQQGGQIAVTLWGSSTCPYVGSDIRVLEEAGEGNRVEIVVPPLPDQPCTMDLVPHTTVFWTPVKVTTTEPLTIEVMDREIELDVK